MNKVANDLKSFAPQAPAGMEDRIHKAMGKKKSFWAFSWRTMSVFAMVSLGVGVLAMIYSNNGESSTIAQNSVQQAKEVKESSSNVVDLNDKSHVILNSEKEAKSLSVKTSRRLKVVQKETSVSDLVIENCKSITIVEPTVEETEKTVEVQRMPEESQVPKPKTEATKPKGRSLKLTRLTGK